MKKIIFFILIAIQIITVVYGQGNKFEELQKKAIKITKQNILENLDKADGDLYVKGVKGKFNAKVNGYLLLENSVLEFGDNASVSKKILLKNSKIITPTTAISAGYAEISPKTVIKHKAKKYDKKNSFSKTFRKKYVKIGMNADSLNISDLFKFYFALFIVLFFIFFLMKNYILQLAYELPNYIFRYSIWSILFYVLFPFLLVVLSLSIVGIPFILFLLLILPFIFLIGFATFISWLGSKIGRDNDYLNFFLGYLLFILTNFAIISTGYWSKSWHSVFTIINISFWGIVFILSGGIGLYFIVITIFKKKDKNEIIKI